MLAANTHALVLLSGGLDSTTTLAIAKTQHKLCSVLSFDYGQRHGVELQAAKIIASRAGVEEHLIVKIDHHSLSGSSLTDHSQSIPSHKTTSHIPNTYVPGRNTLFISYALSIAEHKGLDAIYLGCSSVDYSGYPDCRPEYFEAWRQLTHFANKQGVEGCPIPIHTPLLYLTKAETIQEGFRLGVDYRPTISCYQANQQGEACGKCDSCYLRQQGFKAAGLPDPTLYYLA